MADINNFGVTAGDVANVNIIDYVITATITDSETQAVIADYTADNALHFPAVLNTLSNEQRQALLELIAQPLVLSKAGLS